MMKQVIQLPKEGLDKGIRTFLTERVSYMITLAQISMGNNSDQSVLDDTALLFSTIYTTPHIKGSSSSGCVHDLFYLIPRISAAAHRGSTEIESLAQLTPETVAEYESLLRLVSSWKPSTNDDLYNLCGRVYQQALLVYLTSVLDTESQSHPISTEVYPPTMREAFNCIKALLDSTTLDAAPIATTLCWPLAILGSCARTRFDQNFIDTKLAMLVDAYASQSVQDTRDLLQRLWKSAGPRAYTPLELAKLMRKEDIAILFL
jgi:hypothetical protein